MIEDYYAIVINFAAVTLRTVTVASQVVFILYCSGNVNDAERIETQVKNGTEPQAGDANGPMLCYGLLPCFDNNSAILPFPLANASCLGVRP